MLQRQNVQFQIEMKAKPPVDNLAAGTLSTLWHATMEQSTKMLAHLLVFLEIRNPPKKSRPFLQNTVWMRISTVSNEFGRILSQNL